MRTRLRLTILMFLILVAPGTVHGRAWMLQDGTRIDGKFIRLEGNSVRLGVRRKFKLYLFSRFSVTDQEWIRFHHGLNKLEKDRLREEINERPERVWTLKNGQQWTGRFLRVFKAELPNGAVVSHVTIYPPIQSFPFRDLFQKDQTYVQQVLVELGIEALLEIPDKEGRIPPKTRDKEEENPRDRGSPPPGKFLPLPRVPGDRGKRPAPSPKSESDPDSTPSRPEHDFSPKGPLKRVPYQIVPYPLPRDEFPRDEFPRDEFPRDEFPRDDKPDDDESNEDFFKPPFRPVPDRPRPVPPVPDRPRPDSDEQPESKAPPETEPKDKNSLKDDIMEGNYKDLPTRHGGQLALIIAIVVGALVLLKVLRG